MEDVNEKNIEYGMKDLKFLGFPDTVQAALKEELLKPNKKDTISLEHTGTYTRWDGGKEDVNYQITFNKSANSERYFLNNYTATLKNPFDPTEIKSQTFYINKGDGVTAKEAYNLLNGRPVHKNKLHNRENEEYKAWIQLDFYNKEANGNFKQKQFHQNYGYDLPKTLANYPIKELADVSKKKDIIQSLEKGNMMSVIFAKESGDERMFIVANPQFKNLLVYDSNMKSKIGVERKEQEPDQKKEKKEKVQQDADDEESGKKKKKTGKRARV